MYRMIRPVSLICVCAAGVGCAPSRVSSDSSVRYDRGGDAGLFHVEHAGAMAQTMVYDGDAIVQSYNTGDLLYIRAVEDGIEASGDPNGALFTGQFGSVFVDSDTQVGRFSVTVDPATQQIASIVMEDVGVAPSATIAADADRVTSLVVAAVRMSEAERDAEVARLRALEALGDAVAGIAADVVSGLGVLP